jgi:hypothetical protein
MLKSILALAAAALLLQDAKPVRNPWAGFPTHSSVIIETETSTDSVKKTIRQQTTIEVSPTGEVTHAVGTYEANGDPPIFFEQRKHAPGADVAGVFGKHSTVVDVDLEIGGKKIACVKTEYPRVPAVVWRAKALKVPYRELERNLGDNLALDPDIVRIDLTVTSGGKVESGTFKIVELGHKLSIDGKDVLCVVEEGTLKLDGRALKLTVRRWLNDEVPGRVVRSEVRCVAGGNEILRIERVTSFKVAK